MIAVDEDIIYESARQHMKRLRKGEPATVADCGHDLWKGDFMAEWEGKMLCPDCWKAAVSKMLKESPTQIAIEMGLDLEVIE